MAGRYIRRWGLRPECKETQQHRNPCSGKAPGFQSLTGKKRCKEIEWLSFESYTMPDQQKLREIKKEAAAMTATSFFSDKVILKNLRLQTQPVYGEEPLYDRRVLIPLQRLYGQEGYERLYSHYRKVRACKSQPG